MPHRAQKKAFSPSKTVGRNSQAERDSQRLIMFAVEAQSRIGPRCLASVVVDMAISSSATLRTKMIEQSRKACIP